MSDAAHDHGHGTGPNADVGRHAERSERRHLQIINNNRSND
jgi:hypothetical protein